LLQFRQSLRARELKSDSTVLTGPCTLWKRVTDFADGSSEESWGCVLSEADGVGVYPVTEALNLTSAVSGETTLSGQNMSVSANMTVIVDPTEAVLGGETGGRRDRRLAVTGNKQFVVVRVTCGANVVSKSLADIKADVFSDAVCLKSQMAACSNNALTISEGYNSGGVEVTITSCADIGAAENAVTAALTILVAYNPMTGGGDYFMYCMPPGIGFAGLAYAYTNGRVSVYNDDWCSYVSAQMHEVGHNFNLNHASDGGDEYGDQTGLMGYSYSQDDQSMCFNAPNTYQLGWLTTVTEFTSRPASGNYVLVGHTIFGGGIQAVRLQGTPTSAEDTYIWFNLASGINANTLEGGGRVIVTTRATGTGYAFSYMQAILDVGGSYSPSGAYYAVQVISIASGQATITFDASPSSAPAVAPTAAPVVSPTAAPVVPPTDAPVVSPTAAPVVPPTAAPVVPPTDAPVVSPTAAPVVSPTDAPVVSPTAAPVVPPTDAPVVLPTAAPVGRPTKKSPVVRPTKSPVVRPTKSPVVRPTKPPVVAPTAAPVVAPTAAPVVAPTAAPMAIVCPRLKSRGRKCPDGCIYKKGACIPAPEG
jgi:hypothetical protein